MAGDLQPHQNEGNFILGFMAGLLGGFLVFALVLLKGKPATKRGVYWGFGLHASIFLLFRYANGIGLFF